MLLTKMFGRAGLCDFKIYAISVLSFIGSVCAPDKATLKAENHSLQCTTAGPVQRYNRLPFLGLAPCVVSALTWLVFIPSALAAHYRVAACSTTLSQGLGKINTARGHNCTPIFALSPSARKFFLFPPWPVAPRMILILSLVWTVMTHLMKSRKTENGRLPLGCFLTYSIDKTLLGLFPFAPRESWDRSVFTVLLTSCTT